MTPQQFDELYREYYPLVYARCRSLLGEGGRFSCGVGNRQVQG
jgi:hypothetical protein